MYCYYRIQYVSNCFAFDLIISTIYAAAGILHWTYYYYCIMAVTSAFEFFVNISVYYLPTLHNTMVKLTQWRIYNFCFGIGGGMESVQ